MRHQEFWNLMDKLDWGRTGDDFAVTMPLIDSLYHMSVEEIFSFEEILTQLLYAIDTKDHAKEIGVYAYRDKSGVFEPDDFLYSRCVIIVNGEKLYNEVLGNPKAFIKDMNFKGILNVARHAFEFKTGKQWQYSTKVNYKTYSNKEGWK